MTSDTCCTCANALSSIPPTYDEKTEKPAQYERQLDCCGRIICARCIIDNPRFAKYCPYCQTTSSPSSMSQRLCDPPAYSPLSPNLDEPPPYYEKNGVSNTTVEKNNQCDQPAEDVLHFLDSNLDSVSSLSLRYGVPANALRKKNNIFADHLMTARKTVLIPGEFYKGGVSLSPRPIDGEEEELRKTKVRKWMVACKVTEYDIALLYLEQAEYDPEVAIEAYKADERWEKDHPLEAAKKGKAKAKAKKKWRVAGGLTGQLR